MTRKSRHIRVYDKHKKIWKDACIDTGLNSAELFGKILDSQEINFRQRVKLEEEARKELARRRQFK